MPETLLTIYEQGQNQQAQLNSQGTIIGRSPRCDVVIDSRDVSREHARVFQDPFGRWIFEDLGSSNGMFVNGKRVESCAVLPGEPVVIGPAALSVTGPRDRQVKADASVESTNIVVEDFETEILYGKGKAADASAKPCPDRLAEITTRLSELTSLAALYPEVCRRLAWTPKTVAAVLRVPAGNKPVPKTPDVLACHFGQSAEDPAQQSPGAAYPSHLAFRVSHRVIDEVRATAQPVMAKSIYSSDVEVTVTAVDEHSPRAVVCAPLGEPAQSIDLLYLDVPLGGAANVSPEETFAFVSAVATHVADARKSLAPIDIKTERTTLDHELSLASQIQQRLAPIIPQPIPGFEAAVEYNPVVWVGGDYCDIWTLGDGRIAFALGHVAKTGLPAAMAISNLRTLLRTITFFAPDPADAATHANAHLAATSIEGISIALFLAVLDPAAATITYVSAAHPAPIIAHPESGIKPLGESGDPALGTPGTTFHANVHTMTPGQALIIVSEGVTKAVSPNAEHFDREQLNHLLKRAAGRSAKDIAQAITSAVNDFQASVARQNDITAFVLRRK